MKATTLFVALLAALASPSLAQVPFPPVTDEVACKIKHDVKEANTLAELPPSLQAHLQGAWDRSEPTQTGFADRGEYFNESGDPSKPGPVRRFIRGGVYRGYWYVFFEHGEAITSHQVIVFTPDIRRMIRAQPLNDKRPSPLCAVLDSILDRIDRNLQ